MHLNINKDNDSQLSESNSEKDISSKCQRADTVIILNHYDIVSIQTNVSVYFKNKSNSEFYYRTEQQDNVYKNKTI